MSDDPGASLKLLSIISSFSPLHLLITILEVKYHTRRVCWLELIQY